jgi:hypothetical protein
MSDEIRLRHGIPFSEFGVQFNSEVTRLRLENDGEVNFLWATEWTGPPLHSAMEFLKVGNLTYTGQLAAGIFPTDTVLVIMEKEVVPLQGEQS